MNPAWLERGGLVLGAYFLARVVGKWRGAKRQRAALTTPLVDAALLEAALQPRPREGDDPDLLAEVRDTLAHLNRQAYAEEFWGLHVQLAQLDTTLGPAQKATLRRALLRLLTANDRWLQLVAARTAADLGFRDAARPIQALLALGDSQRFSPGKAEYSEAESGNLRFRAVLEESLAALTPEAEEDEGEQPRAGE